MSLNIIASLSIEFPNRQSWIVWTRQWSQLHSSHPTKSTRIKLKIFPSLSLLPLTHEPPTLLHNTSCRKVSPNNHIHVAPLQRLFLMGRWALWNIRPSRSCIELQQRTLNTRRSPQAITRLTSRCGVWRRWYLANEIPAAVIASTTDARHRTGSILERHM